MTWASNGLPCKVSELKTKPCLCVITIETLYPNVLVRLGKPFGLPIEMSCERLPRQDAAIFNEYRDKD